MHLRGIHVAHDGQDGVVRPVVAAIEVLRFFCGHGQEVGEPTDHARAVGVQLEGMGDDPRPEHRGCVLTGLELCDHAGAFALELVGVEPDLLSGDEEAHLSFRGATAELDPADGPFLVVDIGGGSTEFVVGTTGPGKKVLATLKATFWAGFILTAILYFAIEILFP